MCDSFNNKKIEYMSYLKIQIKYNSDILNCYLLFFINYYNYGFVLIYFW